MVLVVGLDEQYRARAQRLRPLHVVPIFLVPLGLGKEFWCIRSSYRVQLCFPTLQPCSPLLGINVDPADVCRRDNRYGRDVWIVAGLVSSPESTHAVANYHQPLRVAVILRRV